MKLLFVTSIKPKEIKRCYCDGRDHITFKDDKEIGRKVCECAENKKSKLPLLTDVLATPSGKMA